MSAVVDPTVQIEEEHRVSAAFLTDSWEPEWTS